MNKIFTILLAFVIFVFPIIILFVGIKSVIKKIKNKQSIIVPTIFILTIECISLIPLYSLFFDDGLAIAGISLIILNILPLVILLGIIIIGVLVKKKLYKQSKKSHQSWCDSMIDPDKH